MNNELPIFLSSDSYGNFSIIIRGKKYDFERTDTVYHERWKRLLKSKNPKDKWKAVNELKNNIKPLINQNSTPTMQPPKEKQLTFRNWMHESTNFTLLDEAIIKFGTKWKDKDVEQIPLAMWQWIQDKMNESPKWTPAILGDDNKFMTKDQIINLINLKTKNQTPIAQQTNVQPLMATPTSRSVPQQKIWYKVSTLKPINNIPPQSTLAVTQNVDGWEFISSSGESGTLPKNGIQNLIKSELDTDGQKIKSTNPQDLFQQKQPEVDQPIKDEGPRTTQQTVGRNGKSIVIPEKFMTEYNNAIANRFTTTNDPIMINALAGSGKTSMLKHLSSYKKPNEKWLYLVFNKKNQIESNEAFPEGVDVLTTHAYLGRILKANGKSVGGTMDLPPRTQKGEKIYSVLDELVPPDDRTFGKFRWAAVNRIGKIAKLAKAFAVNPNSQTLKKDLESIVQKYNIDMDLSSERVQQDRDYTNDIFEKTGELLRVLLPGSMQRGQFANLRDQDDTLWFSAIYADSINWNVAPKYSVVLMDEVQDFNNCQLVMARKLKEAGCRLVGVGDNNQSIYMFRGAVSDAFEQLQNIISGTDSMALPINFRSDPKVIEFVKQNTHVKDLQANPSKDPEAGEARTDLEYNDFMGMIFEEYKANRTFNQSHAIISRTNAPLASTAMNLLKNDVDFEILGKDLSRELIDHIKKTTWHKPQNHQIEDLPYALSDYLNSLHGRWGDKVSKQDELRQIEQTTEALLSVLQHLDELEFMHNNRRMNTALDFISYIKDKLGGLDPDNEYDSKKLKEKNPNSYITLTTTHKSKGLEWDKVFIVKPDEFDPNKPNITSPEAAQQERNAWYVALTRAKHSINISADDEP
jgi:superfamily I DNA/RNA helicase